MFTFPTKGEESVTLRPEFTAGIVRAFLSNGMQQHLPLKLFSTGPLFRYERPQKGRQRQFHQVNFEYFGYDSPAADVETICLAGHLLYSLSGKTGCTLLINTLGDKESREKYRNALVDYLTPYAKDMSEDSQRRLVSNPLRILDSKSEQDKKIIHDAPKITDYLSSSAKTRFDFVCETLSKMPAMQPMKVSPSLVRGLDYYTDTIFEFVAETGELGTQNTVLAGGRYDGLVEQLGGNSVPAIGFAAGIERLLLLTKTLEWDNVRQLKIMILPFEAVLPEATLMIAAILRNELYAHQRKTNLKWKFTVESLWQGNLKKRMERAAQRNADYVIILGPEEVSRDACVVKNMKTGKQEEVSLANLKDENKLIELFNITQDPGFRRNDEK
ncbi:MAG: histidine--tRNA ligase, partial [Pseudomonadota bacterium]|nr:histidine--tRNA ligase [Pseudomonadota bacterium]